MFIGWQFALRNIVGEIGFAVFQQKNPIPTSQHRTFGTALQPQDGQLSDIDGTVVLANSIGAYQHHEVMLKQMWIVKYDNAKQ